jgi:hypothetical protein
VISIIPWSDSNQNRKDELRAFRHELTDFNPNALAKVIEKVGDTRYSSPPAVEHC